MRDVIDLRLDRRCHQFRASSGRPSCWVANTPDRRARLDILLHRRWKIVRGSYMLLSATLLGAGGMRSLNLP